MSTSEVSSSSIVSKFEWTSKLDVIIPDDDGEVTSKSMENGEKIKRFLNLNLPTCLEAQLIGVHIFSSDLPDLATLASVGVVVGAATCGSAAIGAAGVATAALAVTAGAPAAVSVAATTLPCLVGAGCVGKKIYQMVRHDAVLLWCQRDEIVYFVTLEKLAHGIVLQVATNLQSVVEFVVDRDKSKMNPRVNLFRDPLVTNACQADLR